MMLVGMVLPQRLFKKDQENHDDHGTSEIIVWTCHCDTRFSCWGRGWICFHYFATVQCIFQLQGTLDNKTWSNWLIDLCAKMKLHINSENALHRRIKKSMTVNSHEIAVLIELTLGHLRYRLTDVPPQPNSPPDSVIGQAHPKV